MRGNSMRAPMLLILKVTKPFLNTIDELRSSEMDWINKFGPGRSGTFVQKKTAFEELRQSSYQKTSFERIYPPNIATRNAGG